jgi:hypothetical protein
MAAAQAEEDVASSSGGGCCAQVGPDNFGALRIPAAEHTWQHCFPLQEAWADGTAGAGSVAEGGTAVAPVAVQPVWEDVEAAAGARKAGPRLSELKGLPQYDLCFQGF